MAKKVGFQSVVVTAVAVLAVFSIALALGAGASQALSTNASKAVAKPSTTGKPVVFTDVRRLPQFDDAGAPVQPLFAKPSNASVASAY